MQNLVKCLQQLPASPTQAILSQIQCLIANEEATRFELWMRKRHLSAEANERLDRFSKEKRAKITLFSEMTILLVQEVFRQHCNANMPDAPVEQVIQSLTESFLIANDICNMMTTAPEQDPTTPDNYATFALREILFNYHDQFRYMVGRSYLIYEGLKERCRTEFPNDFFDVEDFFQSTLGISLKVYFHSIFSIFSFWCDQRCDRADPKFQSINPEQWIKDTDARLRINPILTRFTQKWHSALTVTETSSPAEIRKFLYELFELRERPLLQNKNGLHCGNLRFIMRKFWDGPYYEIIAAASTPEKDRFFRFLGRTQEMYIQGLLQSAFRSRFKKITSSNGNPISDAVIEINPSWRLIFEVKAKRPTRDMVSGTQAPAELSSVSQMAFEGLAQLNDRIQEMIADGYRGRITPILVTGGHFPINEFLWEHYFEEVKKLAFFTQSKVDWPQFMDVEAVEVFTALVGKTRVGNLMRDKLSEQWKKENFQTFLFAYYFHANGINEPFNALSDEIFKERMSDLMQTIFPQSTLKTQPKSKWRPAFDLD